MWPCVCTAREIEDSNTLRCFESLCWCNSLLSLALSLSFFLALQRILPPVSLAVPLSLFFIPSFSLHQRADHSFLSTRAQNNHPATWAVLPLSISVSSSLCLLSFPILLPQHLLCSLTFSVLSSGPGLF